MSKKRLVIDLDGTLCLQTDYENYACALPVLNMIQRCNDFFIQGWDVTIFTARGMNTHDGDELAADDALRGLTEKWLKDNGVLYHELRFGKPPADFYVDDKMLTFDQFKSSNARGLPVKPNRIVFTNGCFDLLHEGHIETLKYAKMIAGDGGMVVVGLNSDASVRRIKGSSRPVQNEKTRKTVLESLKFVDSVVLFDEDTPLQLIKAVRPTIIVKSEEYFGLDVVGQELGITVEYAPFIAGQSTTKIVERMK